MKARNTLCLLVSLSLAAVLAGASLLVPVGTAEVQAQVSPRILANFQDNSISFEGFTPNTSLTFEVSSEGSVLLTRTLALNDIGYAKYAAWNSFDIAAGQTVVAYDPSVQKELVVSEAHYDILDLDANQARGVAPAGSTVVVFVHEPGYHERTTVAEQDGTWIAEFQDIVSYRHSSAHILDEDGDATIAKVPTLMVRNMWDCAVYGRYFTSGGSLAVEIYAPDGALMWESSDITADTDGRFNINASAHGQDLRDTHVVVTDQTSGEAKQLAVQPLNLDIFDYQKELVEGTAPTGETIEVTAHTGQGQFNVLAEAVTGHWAADFASQGIDLNPSDRITASLYDSDNDATETQLINFMASSTDDFVHWSWHAVPVTATIYDLDGETVFGPQVFAEMDAMGIGPIATPDDYVDLQPGYRVEIDYGDDRVVDLTLADLAVDTLDRDADRAEGSAPANATVSVMVFDTFWPYFAGDAERARLDVVVDAEGHWMADFGGEQGFDITGDHNVAVFLQEFDGGVSAASAPSFSVTIDIKPGSDPNSINLGSQGVVPVAVLTTDGFDTSNVDRASVVFAGAAPLRWAVEDVDADGDLDLIFHFKTQELELDADSTEATLTGQLLNGMTIEGTDSVNIVP